MTFFRPASRRVLASVLLALALALLGGLAAAAPGVARADGIEVLSQREQTADPTALTFTARVRTEGGLGRAELVYRVLNPDGNVGGGGPADFTPGAETDVTFTLDTRTAARYIPVGSLFTYRWELEDSAGNALTTEERTFTFLDGRYQWQSRVDGPVTVYWHGSNERSASTALAMARVTLESAGALLKTSVPYAIRLVVYRDDNEGSLAMRPRGRTFEQLVNTGGQRVAPDLLLVFSANPDVVRHEVTHIVTHVAGDGPFTSLPSWLDEGFAVFMQSGLGSGYRQALDFLIATDGAVSLRSMQSPSNVPGEVNQFYGQSYSTVAYLIDEFGEQQFAELFRVHHEGSPIDEALESVYGFDQDGLFNRWREANGLQPVSTSARPRATVLPQAEATRAPLAGIPTPSDGAVTPAEEPGGGTGGIEGTEGTEASGGDGGIEGASIAVPGGGPVSTAMVLLASVAIAVALGGAALLVLRRGGSE